MEPKTHGNKIRNYRKLWTRFGYTREHTNTTLLMDSFFGGREG